MRNSNLTILGVDPGIGRVGYGVVRSRGSELALVACGVIETSKKLPVGQRLARIRDGLAQLVSAHRPDRIAIEKLFFSKNVTTAMVVGEARGVIQLAAADARVPVMEYAPAHIKQAVTGYGNADKRQVQRMVQVLFGLKKAPRSDDAADAVAIAVCGSHALAL
jgi:crossover junction endodeoxyribonuclease RuvC